MRANTNIEIFDKIALFLTDEELITPGECVKFLALIKVGGSL